MQEKITLESFQNYQGDVNLEYGGLFVNLDDFKNGYADCLRITDLDSGCGFDGAVMVERITVDFCNAERVKSALQGIGGIEALRESDSKWRKLTIVQECASYYGGDVVADFGGEHRWIIQCDPDGPKEYDGWKTDVVLGENQDLFEYLLENGFLSEFE